MNWSGTRLTTPRFIICAKCEKAVDVSQEFRSEKDIDLHFYVKCHGDYNSVTVKRDFVWDNTNSGTVYAFENDRVPKVSIETPVTGKRSIILDGEF